MQTIEHRARDDVVQTPTPAASAGALLARALDELDTGVLLVDPAGKVLHLNHRARQLLSHGAVLLLRDGVLHSASGNGDGGALANAIEAAATRGLRRLLTLGSASARFVVSVAPVESKVAAVMVGRTQVCDELAVQAYARHYALTAAETRVLAALRKGDTPMSIARTSGVKLSTVRTQIVSIRAKTGTETITALLRQVATLPPMVGALRS